LVQNTPVAAPEGGPSAPSSGLLTARPAAPEDDDFLLALFGESRPELALLPEPVRQQLVELQFRAQRSQYRSDAPDGIDWVLELDRDAAVRPVGRCYLQQGKVEHRLLDLSIATEFRGQGLGSAVLDRLCSAAGAAGVPLRLNVWQDNAGAIRLYRRHGFLADSAESGTDGDPTGYLQLRWSAEAPR
jgi:ribosomal protein S18 acetylase RimI-like enzyme